MRKNVVFYYPVQIRFFLDRILTDAAVPGFLFRGQVHEPPGPGDENPDTSRDYKGNIKKNHRGILV
jgi:hypothetical protein